MFRKVMIATAALATLAAVSAGEASAKIHINGVINVGLPGIYVDPYGGYPAYPAYPAYYDAYGADGDCGYHIVKKKVWNWNHTAYKIITKSVLVCD
jgi:hypothetical protein